MRVLKANHDIHIFDLQCIQKTVAISVPSAEATEVVLTYFVDKLACTDKRVRDKN